MPERQIAIIAALKEELGAVESAVPLPERNGVQLVRGGVGWESSARTVASLLNSPNPPTLICTTGFCGGLTDSVELGDIILATHFIAEGHPTILTDAGRIELFCAALSRAGVCYHSGAMVSARKAVSGCEQKRELGQANKALAVDMESFATAVAAGSRIPVFSIRVVSDAVGDSLPPEVAGFLDEQGNVRAGNVARFALSHPRNMLALWRLKGNTDKASAALTAAWRALWPLLRDLAQPSQ